MNRVMIIIQMVSTRIIRKKLTGMILIVKMITFVL